MIYYEKNALYCRVNAGKINMLLNVVLSSGILPIVLHAEAESGKYHHSDKVPIRTYICPASYSSRQIIDVLLRT
jgi:hypothetical protein